MIDQRLVIYQLFPGVWLLVRRSGYYRGAPFHVTVRLVPCCSTTTGITENASECLDHNMHVGPYHWLDLKIVNIAIISLSTLIIWQELAKD